MFAEIAISKKNAELERIFTYKIPEELEATVMKGSLVQVPFAREKLLGIVIHISEETETKNIKCIEKVISQELLTDELIELGKFISARYLAHLSAVLFSMATFGAKIKNPKKLKNLPVKDSTLIEWPELVPAQVQVLKKIQELKAGRFLLHGVTGSGKTEVYLHLFREAFAKHKQALLLLPEIALTPQLIGIFTERFGSRIQVLHSKLSVGERLLVWQKARLGEIDGVIGARSAIFTPFLKLGVIIMDEEHEYSFKQESSPRFHTRVLAGWRAKYNAATLVYGSATPAIESYYAALTKKLTLLSMSERIAERPMPKVEIIDLRNEIKAGNRSVFSRGLIDKIKQRLERKEQTILFLNRRGYSSFMSCRDCGEVLYCPKCAISLTYHQGIRALRCHYCEFTSTVPAKCPHCNSTNFRRFGVGTERLEEEINNLFPEAKVIRMDVDTTTKKEAHSGIYKNLKSGETDILIGTQMVTKGLDLPLVTLVGVVDADISIFMPDFRAREKTFQLLTQVAGRAGRGDIPGEVVFQTFNPQDFTLLMSAEQNYRAFCESELYKRKMLNYPPYSSMARLVITAEDAEIVEACAHFLSELLKKDLPQHTQMLGPAPAPVAKLRGKYRWHIHLKSEKITAILPYIKKTVTETNKKFKKDNIVIHIDVDPYSAL